MSLIYQNARYRILLKQFSFQYKMKNKMKYFQHRMLLYNSNQQDFEIRRETLPVMEHTHIRDHTRIM